MSQGICKERFSHTYGSTKNYVFMSVDKLETEQLLEHVSINADPGIPIKSFQGLVVVHLRVANPASETVVLPPSKLILKYEFKELYEGELVCFRVRDSILKADENA
jgi:hypothetical protein